MRAGECCNGIKQAEYEVLTKFFSYLKDPFMLLFMEYNVVQISAVARIRLVQDSMTLPHRSR